MAQYYLVCATNLFQVPAKGIDVENKVCPPRKSKEVLLFQTTLTVDAKIKWNNLKTPKLIQRHR